MTDVDAAIEDLKGWETHYSPYEEMRDNAIAALEALRAENAKLREALKPFSDMAKYYDANGIPTTRLIANVQIRLLRAARAAMGESDG